MLSEWITEWLCSLLPEFTLTDPCIYFVYIIQNTTHSLSYSATISKTYRTPEHRGCSILMLMKHQKCFMKEVLFELGLGGLRGSEEREGSLGGSRGAAAGKEGQGKGFFQESRRLEPWRSMIIPLEGLWKQKGLSTPTCIRNPELRISPTWRARSIHQVSTLICPAVQLELHSTRATSGTWCALGELWCKHANCLLLALHHHSGPLL